MAWRPTRATVTVLDDYEDQSLSDYNGDTGTYGFQTTSPMEGSANLESTSGFGRIASTDPATTPRGYKYRHWFEHDSADVHYFWTNIQNNSGSSGAFNDDCYQLSVSVSGNSVTLYTRNSDSQTELGSISATMNAGTTYKAEIEVQSDAVGATLYDASDNILGSVSPVANTDHSGGHFGYYSNASGLNYDYVTQRPI